MSWQKITECIAYFPASEEPLSADVGLVRGDRFDWIFDVGSSPEAARLVQGLQRETNVVLSHFHKDHTGNLDKIAPCEIYCGPYTQRKLGRGTAVRQPLARNDGVELLLFPIPSVHAKGSVGLEVNGEYAFVGDALYPSDKGYNVSLLYETITALKAISAPYLLVSHERGFVRPKAEAIQKLESICRMRRPGENYIEAQ